MPMQADTAFPVGRVLRRVGVRSAYQEPRRESRRFQAEPAESRPAGRCGNGRGKDHGLRSVAASLSLGTLAAVDWRMNLLTPQNDFPLTQFCLMKRHGTLVIHGRQYPSFWR